MVLLSSPAASTACTDNNIGTATNTAATAASITTREGRIIRKKKFKNFVSLAIRVTCIDAEQQENESELVSSIPVLVDRRSSTCLQWCYLGALIRVEGLLDPEGDDEKSNNNDDNKNNRLNHLKANRVELIQCAPDPNAVLLCLKLVARQELPLEVFFMTHLEQMKQVTEILEELSREDQRKEVGKIVRELQGLGAERVTSQRTPHTRQRHLRMLERMEQEIPVRKIHKANVESDPQQDERTSTRELKCPFSTINAQHQTKLWNLPTKSCHDTSTDDNNSSVSLSSRVEYLQQKKWPQIRYILQRLATLCDGHSNNGSFRCLDVGGGRGDLATAISLTFPQAHVTVVDKNESSLNAGKIYAQELGISVAMSDDDNRLHDGCDLKNSNPPPRMRFFCADFQLFLQEYSTTGTKEDTPFDVVVALHACGDLSDLALQFSHQIGAKFVICPCCYSKRFFTVEPTWAQYYKETYHHHYRCNSVGQPLSPSMDNASVQDQNDCDDKEEEDHSEVEKCIKAVQRLAELNERPAISQRAMHVINSLRLEALQKQRLDSSGDDTVSPRKNVQLEEYENAFSKRNIVLVGAD